VPDRVVRFTESFFEDLDRQLPGERSADGVPSRTDFLLHDVPRLRDRLAQDFEANTLAALGNEPIRVMIGRGVLVPEVALYAYLVGDDTVLVIAIELNVTFEADEQ
jgi:hypothetical protein